MAIFRFCHGAFLNLIYCFKLMLFRQTNHGLDPEPVAFGYQVKDSCLYVRRRRGVVRRRRGRGLVCRATKCIWGKVFPKLCYDKITLVISEHGCKSSGSPLCGKRIFSPIRRRSWRPSNDIIHGLLRRGDGRCGRNGKSGSNSSCDFKFFAKVLDGSFELCALLRELGTHSETCIHLFFECYKQSTHQSMNIGPPDRTAHTRRNDSFGILYQTSITNHDFTHPCLTSSPATSGGVQPTGFMCLPSARLGPPTFAMFAR